MPILCLTLHLCAGSAAPELDRPPSQLEKAYSPADEQLVEVTPPPFIWVPAGRGSVYMVQVSRSADFTPEATIAYGPTARSVFVPREPLPAGLWWWRFGVETSNGFVYGRPRPFTILPAARPFPFPDLDAAVGRVPRERPRLFFSGERLERARKAAREELKDQIAFLVRSCERAIGEDLVAEPGYRPKEPLESGPWAVSVMRTTRPPMDAMEHCALAYLLTGDRRLGEEAKRRLLHFFSWDPEGPTSFFAYDEPPMWMMMRGTRTYDWIHALFSVEERARIERAMKARALQFLDRLESTRFESRPYDSHAGRLPGFLGECAISFIHEWPEARNWLEYVTLIYYTAYPAWGGDDGGWHEGPGYWSSYMSFALHFVVAARNAAGIDLMQKPFFRNTPFYGLYTAPPYHEHSPFGDGQTGSPGGRLAGVMYAFSTLLRDPHLRWYPEAAGHRPGRDLLSLATYDPSIEPELPRGLPKARFFPAVGLVSLHTALGVPGEDVAFLMRSSPLGSVSHGHADQNAFAIEAFGRGLAIATGYYPWYGSPHHHKWTRQTKAVNSILVNGEGQVVRRADANGAITAFLPGEGYDYVEAEAAPAYGGRLKRFTRQVVHVRPGLFVICDDLAAPKPATFQWLLHSFDEMRIDAAARSVTIERSPARMHVRFLSPAELDFTQTDRYDPEPEQTQGNWEKTWHLAAATRQAAAEVRFLTVLLPHRTGSEAELPEVRLLAGEGAIGVCLTAKDGSTDLVAFRADRSRETISCGGVTSAASVFARGTKRDGTLVRELEVPRRTRDAPARLR